jgi:hypothetical protein
VRLCRKSNYSAASANSVPLREPKARGRGYALERNDIRVQQNRSPECYGTMKCHPALNRDSPYLIAAGYACSQPDSKPRYLPKFTL